jgi:glutamyl-tRNA synthetase
VALFNFAFARQQGGRFVLRIEDTDQQRSSPQSERMILDALRWLGLQWDEGPDTGGPFGPYRQSERTAIYREHVDLLVARGAAYPCFCSRERLDALRAEQKATKARFGYDGRCRSLTPEEARQRVGAGEEHVVRLAMPETGETVAHDLLRGAITIANDQVDDQILLKSDGLPTYHLANVVDDHLMEISHVIRAEEWISSLPKHVRLYEAFGWEQPVFCHLPLLRTADRSKISKRKNPVSLDYYRTAGILPEALLNYLALMGWAMSDEREQFTMEEFIEAVRLEGISLGGPVFDLDKLNWLNGRSIRDLGSGELLQRLQEMPLADGYLREIVPLVQDRIETLADFVPYASFFFAGNVSFEPHALPRLVAKGRSPAETSKALRTLLEEWLDPILDWNESTIDIALRSFMEQEGWSTKELFMPLRVAVTGRTATPPLFETMAVLGKARCRWRLRQAIEALRSMKG